MVSETLNEACMKPTLRKFLPLALAIAAQLLILKSLGRRWWCEQMDASPIGTSAWDIHTSQHIFDPYSLSHLQHGIVFFALLTLLKRPSLLLAVLLEIAWEILENTPLVIDRYRAVTASLGYSGDSIINSLGDTLSCACGYMLASKMGGKWALLLFLAVEATMLYIYRDSLTLNVIMLLYPLQIIKDWQTSGLVSPAG